MMQGLKKIIILGSASLLIVVLTLVYFLMPKNEEVEEEVFVSKASDIIFSSIDESVSLGDITPTLDKFGVLNEALNFTIKNIGEKNHEYVLKLVDENSTIKNSFIRYQLTKNGVTVGIFSLQDNGIIDTDTIMVNTEISYSIRIWLDYKSEAKAGSVNLKININEKEFVSENSVNEPILVDGMIPVYYDESKMSFVKTSADNLHNYEWYNYDNGKWANAVTVDSEKRDYYKKMAIGEAIDMKDINAMWVWIPRFNYSFNDGKITVDFVSNSEDAYEAFTFDNTKESGFWISKFEAGLDENSTCIKKLLTNECNHQNQVLYFKPNMVSMTRISMANLFYSFRKMELQNNIYGFSGNGTSVNNDGTIKEDDNNLDIHMIRNSEWQAVAILSKSSYGNKNGVAANDSNYTGKAYYNREEYNYDVIGYGTMASTTGTIYGVYDMTGAKREYVMFSTSDNNLFSNNSNSGFNSEVKNFYYDKGLSASDKSVLLSLNLSEYLINSEPLTRGGYRSIDSNIFSLYGVSNYSDKVSLETSSRVVLSIINGGNDGEKKTES